MIWKKIRWVLILAMCLIIVYLLYAYLFKKIEEGAAAAPLSIPRGVPDLTTTPDGFDTGMFPNGLLPKYPNIKRNAIIKLQGEGYDISGLDVKYNSICSDINDSIAKYKSVFKLNQPSNMTDFVYTFAKNFVYSDNDFILDSTKTGIDAGALGLPSSQGGKNPFKLEFGGLTDSTGSKITKAKSGTVDFIENSEDTFKLTDLSPFGLLNYYYLKLYVVTEWYMFYVNGPTIAVTDVKGVPDKWQEILDKRKADIEIASQVESAQHKKWKDAYDDSCGNKDECPGRYQYEKDQKSNLDRDTAAKNALINGNPNAYNDPNGALSVKDLQANIKDGAIKAAADLKTAQDAAQNAYQIFRASALTSLPGLIPGILAGISKNIEVVQNVNTAIKKLTDSFTASYAAKASRILYLTSLQNSSYSSPEDIVKKAVPRFFESSQSFDINQIEDFKGYIGDDIKKLHLLNSFNGAYDIPVNISSPVSNAAPGQAPQTKTAAPKVTSANALITSIIDNANANITYFTDPLVKSDERFRQLDKYIYTYENCNAINYLIDIYYRDITFLSDKVYAYLIDSVYQKSNSPVPDSPLCNLSKDSAKSPSSQSTEECIISPDNIYMYMKNIERKMFDAKGKMIDLELINVNDDDDSTKDYKNIIAYSAQTIDKLLNIRNFAFMLFVRCGLMIKYVFDNYAVYTKQNSTETPIDGSLYTIGEFAVLCTKTRIFTESNTQFEIERFVYYLSEVCLKNIHDQLYNEYTGRYLVKPKQLINISQGINVYDTALQYISYIESTNKFTQNIIMIYEKVNTSFNLKLNAINSDIAYCNSTFSKFKSNNLTLDVNAFDVYTYVNIPLTLSSGVKISPPPNEELLQKCRSIRDKLKNYLYLPTYFSNGSLNGCYQDPTRNNVFNDDNSFQIGVVTTTTGSKSDPKADRYGAVVNCINDTVAYNNVNNTKYDTVTLKPYGITSDAYYCYAGMNSDLKPKPGSSAFVNETDVSKCYIDKGVNIADTTITYSVNPMQFDPVKDNIIFRGCYATSDISSGIYNTLPHQIGGDLSWYVLNGDPNAAIKQCQQLVQNENKKGNKNYDIYGITSDPNNTNLLYCFAGNSKFDAAHALDSNLARSDYTRGCNVQYPGPGNYMVFQDGSAALNSCKTTSQTALDKYNDAKTSWLNTNITHQTDSLKLISGLMDEIDKRFPVKFEISNTNLVKSGFNKPDKYITIDTGSADASLNKFKLNIYLNQGPIGNTGDKGDQGRIGNDTIGDAGLPGHQGYYG